MTDQLLNTLNYHNFRIRVYRGFMNIYAEARFPGVATLTSKPHETVDDAVADAKGQVDKFILGLEKVG